MLLDAQGLGEGLPRRDGRGQRGRDGGGGVEGRHREGKREGSKKGDKRKKWEVVVIDDESLFVVIFFC